MDKATAFALAIGVAVGVAGTAAAFVVYSALFGVIISPQDCPLEFVVWTLDTPGGWFYRVTGVEGEPRPLDAYTVEFFILGRADAYGNQAQIVEYAGPLPGLLGAMGNFSFHDRGIHPGELDDGGDYFWARTWHKLFVYRGEQLVGGTVSCA